MTCTALEWALAFGAGSIGLALLISAAMAFVAINKMFRMRDDLRHDQQRAIEPQPRRERFKL